jgi:hypothetical protein
MQKAKIQSKNKKESAEENRRQPYLHFTLSFCYLIFDI